MPWKERNRVEERLEFAALYAKREASMAELCRRFGISRRTGYKWAGRYLVEGPAGLRDRSSRPRSNPRAVSEEMTEFLLQARRSRPYWGPKKIRARMMEANPGVEFPSASTIGEIFQRHGLTKPRRYRRHAPPMSEPFADCKEPNAVWSTDFKGHFKVRGQRCYPLTLMDSFSRYILRCDALKETGTDSVQPCFKQAFREYGMPWAILMDNGSPFASTSAGGLSRLSVWWVKLGITPQRIEPGHPEQNPRHERMHRTLKAETASPPQPSFPRQQRVFDLFRAEYNYERPHEALGQIPPARVYAPSSRQFVERPEDPEYPSDHEQRRVQHNGVIRWRGESIFISTPLRGELVGLNEVDYEQWEVYFGPVHLGEINERNRPWRLRRPRKRRSRAELKGP